MNVLAVGIILNTKSMLGVGSINTIPYALAHILNMSLGTTTTCLYIIFIIIQLILIKKLDIQILMQLPYSFIFGILLDFYNTFLNITIQSISIQFILLFIAILLTALGAFMMLQGNIVLNPADGIVKTLGDVSQKEFGAVKNIFDISSIIITTIICLITKGYIIGIGIGTVLSAILIGRCVALYQKIYRNYRVERVL